ncbi:hypothetical protein [Komagataeibacter saccharivorans]|uniref:hypothetical protein n=1 Tax=Komagataeibacter saccharivorans TaxID=265959 RepID=UPI000C827D27|nr:hypothetical protein [Komagataeibacter saccharivorans]
MTDHTNDIHLNNIYEGLACSEYRMRESIKRETRPEIREDLEKELSHILKARESHEHLAEMLP